MFEIGWTEMLVIAVVMIVVVGPKDLPKMLRTMGRMTAKARSMAGDFQRQFNEALKEAELDDVKKSVDELRGLNPAQQIRKQLNPFEQAASDVRAGLDAAMKPSQPAPSADPAVDATHPAEPLKNGATVMPGVAGPDAMPATSPVFPAAEVKATPVPAPAVAAKAEEPKAATKPKAAAKAVAAPKLAAKAQASVATTKAPVAKSAPAKAPVAKAASAKAVAPKKTAKTTKAGKAS
ncbi:Sec-independent protein translocase protein TatB [Aminobacter sp. Y103A]|jgi:sec-independent protein translocase protein TatB|uniref:Sec-independent protein translocase protein TatB n=1 Tax=Aminobacter aminovorans TaxID=83263 RepID=A0AAC8YQ70_AMIAI|nr:MULTISPECIES: Sec-independent protein translocase protein TatB [Aminobacter]AMS42266.1 Sec-independent protein translocase protein TatB [Aminobacter aminovorans]MBB3709143.1 sec-independent protein translocase protein TatB [Aminobacter aminovorans]BBD38195.1 Sec-independent protein translocase protein TatB [Aminobacter sp. SS-2016]